MYSLLSALVLVLRNELKLATRQALAQPSKATAYKLLAENKVLRERGSKASEAGAILSRNGAVIKCERQILIGSDGAEMLSAAAEVTMSHITATEGLPNQCAGRSGARRR